MLTQDRSAEQRSDGDTPGGVERQRVVERSGCEVLGPTTTIYELFLHLEGIEDKKTRVERPQSNGISERFHRSLADEHVRIKRRKT